MSPEFFAAVAAGSLVVMLFLLSGLFVRDRTKERVGALASGASGVAYVGALDGGAGGIGEDVIARRMRHVEKKNQLKERMLQAGLYSKTSSNVFVFIRIVSFIVPTTIGVVAWRSGIVSLTNGVVMGMLIGLAGVVAPSFWLDYLKSSRQTRIRKALPDALDVISVCLEGGLSLSAAISRVAHELATAHPMLALELAIVERQVQMGQTTGQAMRELAQRFDLEELRSLSSVILHADRYGTSVNKALAVYAETLRTKRHQRAEENAQKAIIKMLFPTLFLIFPGIFIVVVGPAAIQIYHVLIKQLMNAPTIPV